MKRFRFIKRMYKVLSATAAGGVMVGFNKWRTIPE
jgi:hypothetical protein